MAQGCRLLAAHLTWVLFDADDVINVAGHRLTTGRLEEICISHHAVVECAVVATDDEIKGQVPFALLVLLGGDKGTAEHERVSREVVEMVGDQLGAIACLRQATVIKGLPKTRSGKILRNVIRAISNDTPYKVRPAMMMP